MKKKTSAIPTLVLQFEKNGGRVFGNINNGEGAIWEGGGGGKRRILIVSY